MLSPAIIPAITTFGRVVATALASSNPATMVAGGAGLILTAVAFKVLKSGAIKKLVISTAAVHIWFH